MRYEKPTMDFLELCFEDVVCASLEVNPNKPFPNIGEDGEDWEK